VRVVVLVDVVEVVLVKVDVVVVVLVKVVDDVVRVVVISQIGGNSEEGA